MKKMFAVLLALVMLLPVASSLAAAEDAPVTIRISWWGDTARHEKYNAICDAFEAENPGITVERESNTWADYWNKLSTQVAGSNAPDLMGMHPQFVSDYASRGVLADLAPYVADGTLDTTNIPQSVLDGGTIGGQLSMIAMGLTVQTVIVNKSLCDELGVEVPKMGENWTWDSFSDKAIEFREKAVAAGKDVYFASEATGYTCFQYLARSNGGDLYTADGKLGFTEADLSQWLTMWKTLRDADAVPDGATTSESLSLTLEQNLFCTQQCATAFIPVNQLWLYMRQLPETTIVADFMPLGSDNQCGAFLEGAHWAMSANADDAHRKAAASLLNFIANNEGAAQFMQMDQGVPANTKMAEFIMPLLTEADKMAVEFVNLVSPTITKPLIYAPKGATSISTIFSDARDSVAFGAATPQEAAATFFTQANAVLAENQ